MPAAAESKTALTNFFSLRSFRVRCVLYTCAKLHTFLFNRLFNECTLLLSSIFIFTRDKHDLIFISLLFTTIYYQRINQSKRCTREAPQTLRTKRTFRVKKKLVFVFYKS